MSDRVPSGAGWLRAALVDWLRPPRAHGQIIEDRTVSFLELFYDLVFVVLVSQVASTLAEDVTWVGLWHFVVVLALVWLAWINGSLYHELHGGEDGRSRAYIFVQMGLLVLLGVYAGRAAADGAAGRGFAIVYAVLVLVLSWQWWQVRQQDVIADVRTAASRYIAGSLMVATAMGASSLVDDPENRVGLWSVVTVLTLIAVQYQLSRPTEAVVDSLRVTDSMAERFGLFTIIVLGEVVVGVVDGLAELDRRPFGTVVTALLALCIGFGFWWNYFDFAGRRVPRPGPVVRTVWMTAHLPLALSVAATGAGMVSLVEHAGEGRTPSPTAWLIAGATTAMALSLAVVVWTMGAHPGRSLVPVSLGAAACASLVVGAVRPAPWLLALLLFSLLSAVWVEAFVRHARSGLRIAET